jgi:hypothetical protein
LRHGAALDLIIGLLYLFLGSAGPAQRSSLVTPTVVGPATPTSTATAGVLGGRLGLAGCSSGIPARKIQREKSADVVITVSDIIIMIIIIKIGNIMIFIISIKMGSIEKLVKRFC